MAEEHNPPPRWGTPRNPARRTLGPQVGKVMAAFSNPPMPWQRDFLAAACELDPATGLYWYTKVILILPRQGGKTSTSRGKITHRALTTRNGRLLYTAQDRNKARKRLEENFHVPITESPLREFLDRATWQNGAESLRWKNGAKLSIDAVSKKTGHGDTLHEAHIDEAYAHRDNTIEGGIGPTMATVDGAQRWVTSAAGNLESDYLMAQRDMGRALVESGQESRTLYWEFSAQEDADPYDPATALAAHPAITHTISLDFVMNELRTDPDPAEVQRAYLGWWPVPRGPEPVIPIALWEDCHVPDEGEYWKGLPLWIVDVSPDRQWSSLGMAGVPIEQRPGGTRCFLELIDHELGTDWVVDRLKRLRSRFGGDVVALDGGGGAKSLATDLEEAGFEVITMPSAQRAEACTGFYDDVLARRLAIAKHSDLNKALAAAKKKRSGPSSWVFASKGEDISPMYQMVVGRWAVVKHGDRLAGFEETLG